MNRRLCKISLSVMITSFWEHAIGKIDKSLFREGGEWK